MKVLDLQCAGLHRFEGWFASEDDFAEQRSRQAIHCPLCSSSEIVKRLSAPRLSFGATPDLACTPINQPETPVAQLPALSQDQWVQVCKDILASTTDVGTAFTEAARKIHYGEAPQRAIRGQATQEQVQTLVDEGIGVLPLPIPEFLLEPRH
jgi:hypothetical protein